MKTKTNFFLGDFEIQVVLSLMGSFPGREIYNKFAGVPLIAADGAGISLLDNGVEPDLIIGDIDSFGRSRYYKYFPKDKIITVTDQETNDFEKCLLYCEKENLTNILITGFGGGQLEHTLNNWSILAKYCECFNFRLLEKDRIAKVFGEGTYEIVSSEKDSIISIIPQMQAVLTTENFVYPLNNERLEIGYREGGRNQIIGTNATLTVHSG